MVIRKLVLFLSIISLSFATQAMENLPATSTSTDEVLALCKKGDENITKLALLLKDLFEHDINQHLMAIPEEAYTDFEPPIESTDSLHSGESIQPIIVPMLDKKIIDMHQGKFNATAKLFLLTILEDFGEKVLSSIDINLLLCTKIASLYIDSISTYLSAKFEPNTMDCIQTIIKIIPGYLKEFKMHKTLYFSLSFINERLLAKTAKAIKADKDLYQKWAQYKFLKERASTAFTTKTVFFMPGIIKKEDVTHADLEEYEQFEAIKEKVRNSSFITKPPIVTYSKNR